MFFERVDDLVRVAHGPAGGVAQFVELLLVFVFVGGHAVGPGVTIGTSSMRITPVTSAGHRNRSGRNMPPTRPASTARANMISRTVAVPGTRAAIENTYSASTATDNTAQDAAITGCPACRRPSRSESWGRADRIWRMRPAPPCGWRLPACRPRGART
ncbi:hypothetical protein [Bifidobacterium breve]|uniref:hypothetical protein n=1 Tax=Bifidobacterium breve TaxID=1685 RepID=UPI0014951076|nr:hypothetical protein [Bifidobacterium breve]